MSADRPARARRVTPGRRRALTSCLILSLLPGAAAQSLPFARGDRMGDSRGTTSHGVFAAATDSSLWLLHVGDDGVKVFQRPKAGPFDLGTDIGRVPDVMAAGEQFLFVTLQDGTCYRIQPGRVERLRALPPGRAAIDMAARGDTLFVLARNEDAEPPGARFSLLVSQGGEWTQRSDLPAETPVSERAALAPRLCVSGDRVLAVSRAPDVPKALRTAVFDESTGSWSLADHDLELSGLDGFWIALVDRVPTLVASVARDEGAETLEFFRVLGPPDPRTLAWRPWEVQLSAPPLPADGAGLSSAPAIGATATLAGVELQGVVGFNQHLGLLVADRDGRRFIVFGRGDGPPFEKTLDVAEVVRRPVTLRQTHDQLQAVSFAVLLMLLIGLFVFRRDSMVRTADLPPGYDVALLFQRMIAGAIDFVPIAAVCGWAMGASWQSSFSLLLDWGVSPTPSLEDPTRGALLWWAVSCLVFVVYTTFSELVFTRTLGKLLLRMSVLTEKGGRPRLWQIVTRNLLRLIELAPQFWVFILLAVFSRNRQRLGDIFARTVVARRVGPGHAQSDAKRAAEDDAAPGDSSHVERRMLARVDAPGREALPSHHLRLGEVMVLNDPQLDPTLPRPLPEREGG